MSLTIKILPPKLRYPELPTGSMQYKCGLGEDFYDYFWKTLSESERDEMKRFEGTAALLLESYEERREQIRKTLS